MVGEQPSWLWSLLECPGCRSELGTVGGSLTCLQGHRFPILDGIPVLMVQELDATHPAVDHARDLVRNHASVQFASSYGDQQIAWSCGDSQIDPYVAANVVGTCGNMYRTLPRGLNRYPIPRLEFSGIPSGFFVDVGSGWGRWGLAAARRGFQVCCVDPSLDMLRAARRVARQLGASIAVVAGDARRLPLREGSCDVVFSYSVIQHFSKADAGLIAREMARVCRTGGMVIVQMPNKAGLRNCTSQVLQLIRKDRNPFRVRYWALREIEALWAPYSASIALRADGFFSLNPRVEDIDLLRRRYRILVILSDRLRRLSFRWRVLVALADSLWVECIRADGAQNPEFSPVAVRG